MMFLLLIAAFILTVIFLVYFFLSFDFNTVHDLQFQRYFDSNKGISVPFPSLVLDEHSLYLSVIIPAYNEEYRLSCMLEECILHLESKARASNSFTYEIIIVDDGSKDGTYEKAMNYSETYGPDVIRVLSFDKNRGKGAAVTAGVLASRGSVVLFADADGATRFSDFDLLEDEMKSIDSVFAVICGSRSHQTSKTYDACVQRSFGRSVLTTLFHVVFIRSLGLGGIKDTQCGFKLFTRASAKKIFTNIHVKRWAFDVEILYISRKLNIPILEVGVNWTEIDGSKLVPFLVGFKWRMMWR